MRFYSNREMAQRLKLPIARWKRWSREFLPPDPLGGLQSGYARQYNLRDGFAVFLGGHLVSDLGFSVPEARTLLKLVGPWLRRHLLPLGERQSGDRDDPGEGGGYPQYHLMITPARDLAGPRGAMVCDIRTIVSEEPPTADGGLGRLEFQDHRLGKASAGEGTALTVKIVRLSTLFTFFRDSINRA